MSARRDGRSGPGGDAPDDGPDRQADVDVVSSGPTSHTKALVSRTQNKLVVAERRPPARALSGMAGPEQLDAFRELRTRLVSSPAAVGLSHFTTVIVPVSSGAGGSFVARNLAAAFALEERRLAILVDCNLRHPTQDAAFGMHVVDRGLFDYLERPHGGVDSLIRPTSLPGLHLIPAGRPPSIPREYLSSHGMRMVMDALRQPSCYVFLDAPPAKGSPDARILADLADFVVLVVGYGRETPEAIAKTAALFEPSKLAGVVFNERV